MYVTYTYIGHIYIYINIHIYVYKHVYIYITYYIRIYVYMVYDFHISWRRARHKLKGPLLRHAMLTRHC